MTVRAQITYTVRTFNPKTLNLEIMKDMSKNGKGPMLALIAVICLLLAGCGGGGAGSSSSTPTPAPGGNTATGHPNGVWSTLPNAMPINPVHAALLHTGKVLIVSGSGNCPPQQAG